MLDIEKNSTEKKSKIEEQTYTETKIATALSKLSKKEIEELKETAKRNFSGNAYTVLKRRYLRRNHLGEVVETPFEMFVRVAGAAAEAELQYSPGNEEKFTIYFREFLSGMINRNFMPNSPTLMNAWRRLGMLSACFTLPVEDDLESIMKTCHDIVMTQRAGGGTGMNFSKLRPRGSVVTSSGGVTNGPLDFIDMYSAATSAIQQGAFRRGANMGILDIDHPDIYYFIMAKQDLSRWQNYNISVSVPDRFIHTLRDNPETYHEVSHPKWGEGYIYELEDGTVESFPHNKAPKDYKRIFTVQDIWDIICKNAWNTGEPGLFFPDRANRNSPIPELGKIITTNPCGEEPMYSYESCNLASINLANFVKQPTEPLVNHLNEELLEDEEICKELAKGIWDRYINQTDLAITIDTVVRFLDNVITINNYPIKEYKDAILKTRRIGLGIMGLADLFYKLSIPYHSHIAFALSNLLAKFVKEQAHAASARLGKDRGPFGMYLSATKDSCMRRNAYVTTIAPTGTISIISGCSAGIEPLFALRMVRKVMPDSSGNFQVLHELNQIFVDNLKRLSIARYGNEKYADKIIDHVNQTGSLKGFKIPEKLDNESKKAYNDLYEYANKVFVIAEDLTPADHVIMQSIWQRYIDAGVSKTINMSAEAKVENISDIYLMAHELDCCGITIYRDGCRNNVAGMQQPMQKVSSPSKETLNEEPVNKKFVVNGVLDAVRTVLPTPFGTLHLFVTLDDEGVEKEIFAQIGKSGHIVAGDLEGLCRLSSKLLQNGVTINEVISQLEDIGSSLPVGPSSEGRISSVPDALAKALKKYLKETSQLEKSEEKRETKEDRINNMYGVPCPSCGSSLHFIEGCKTCQACGYSAC